MASTSKLNFLTLSSTSDTSNGSLDLHEMFSIVGNQMTTKDVRSLKFLYKRIMPKNIYSKVNDGYTFLLALEKIGRLDETNFTYLLQVLRIITRHDLSQYVHLRRRGTVKADPVDEYLLRTTRRSTPLPDTQTVRATIPATSKRRSTDVEQTVVERPAKRPHLVHLHSTRLTRSHSSGIDERQETCHTNSTSSPAASCSHESADHSPEIKKKVTCDIRLRVRAEYCDHDTALEGNIFSNKPDMLERQFEKFMQANTILKSRDLGSIICDIKFSELTYLDAFWRDYINGSLLEALKGVFITESLKQAVGHEAIKLLVNVDEDDYEAGREKLLQNLSE